MNKTQTLILKAGGVCLSTSAVSVLWWRPVFVSGLLTQISEQHCLRFWVAAPGRSLRMGISSKFPGDTAPRGPGTTENHRVQSSCYNNPPYSPLCQQRRRFYLEFCPLKYAFSISVSLCSYLSYMSVKHEVPVRVVELERGMNYIPVLFTFVFER